MKKKYAFWLVFPLALLSLVLTGCLNKNDRVNEESTTEEVKGKDVTLDFYALNDWHGNVKDSDLSIGISRTATFLKQKSHNQNALFVSSGDMWQGSLESNSTRGELMMEWMEYMDFTSMTLGNHEFDWGEDAIRNCANKYNVPILGINVIDKNTHERVDYAQPSVVVEKAGAKIGIIGAIGDCYSSVSYSQVKDVSFIVDKQGQAQQPLSDLIKAESTRLRQQEGCDFIVYSVHGDSYRNDTYYNPELSSGGYVDVVLEGHKHAETFQKDASGIWHFQCNADGTMAINHFRVNLNTGTDKYTVLFSESSDAYRMNTTDKRSLALDDGTEAIIDHYDFSEFYQALGNNMAYRNNKYLRQLCVDLYLSYGLAKWQEGLDADVVLAGGYISCRGDYLQEGEVNYSTLYTLFPFDNAIVLIKTTGAAMQNVFFDTTNANYFEAYTDYGNTLFDNRSLINTNGQYYLITDTYTSDWMEANNYPIIIVDYYSDGEVFARDLFADYASKNGFNTPAAPNPWDDVPYMHIGRSIDSPFNISEAYKIAKEDGEGPFSFFVKGKVVDVSIASIKNGKYCNFYIADVDGSYQDLKMKVTALNRYDGALINDGFTSTGQLSVGDTIIMYATFKDAINHIPYFTDECSMIKLNDSLPGGNSKDNPISLNMFMVFGGITGEVYLKGRIFDITYNDGGEITRFLFEGDHKSPLYKYGAINPPSVYFQDDISIAEGLSYSEINYGMYVTLKYNAPTIQIVAYENPPSAKMGDGTLENPYNVEQAMNIAALYQNENDAPQVYCYGTVSRVGQSLGGAGDICRIYIEDGYDHEIMIYYLKKAPGANNNVNPGSNFQSVDDLPVGTELVIYGRPYNYRGNTLEFATGTYCVSINGVPTSA